VKWSDFGVLAKSESEAWRYHSVCEVVQGVSVMRIEARQREREKRGAHNDGDVRVLLAPLEDEVLQRRGRSGASYDQVAVRAGDNTVSEETPERERNGNRTKAGASRTRRPRSRMSAGGS